MKNRCLPARLCLVVLLAGGILAPAVASCRSGGEPEAPVRESGGFKYDDADWHYYGDFPPDQPYEQATVHIGMFLGWIIDHDLYSDFFRAQSGDLIGAFKRREVTGAELLREKWDGVLSEEMLNGAGKAFAQDYYVEGEDKYYSDYAGLTVDLPTVYHLPDTWANYEALRKTIDQRYEEWKTTR